jgi:signal transduction histidine kinase
MNPRPRVRAHLRPEPAELLSIGERSRYLFPLRAGLAAIAVATTAYGPEPTQSAAVIGVGALAYVLVALLPGLLLRRSRAVALPVIGAMLLLDGIFLAAGVAVTGGAASPLRMLFFAHVIGVTLLLSYRTGLKVTLWHTLLFLLVVESQRAGFLEGAVEGGAEVAFLRVVVFTLTGLWITALGTATFAALSERELRRQKIDLERMSVMVGRIEAAQDADEIPRILLEELCDTFAFRRGVVLASPRGELEPMASTEGRPRVTAPLEMDTLVERAWTERAPIAVRAIDPTTDPYLARSLPDATNVLLVPLFLDRGRRLGVVMLERAGDDTGIRRWVLAMVAQFASHAALALNNAWLSEEREAKLAEIRELQEELRAHNADLEVKVADRTQELRTVIGELQEIDGQRRRLLDHVVRASEDERQRIANDVHDDPVQKMIAVKMRLELLGKVHPELVEIPQALDVVRGSIRSLRHLLFDLRPPLLDESGLGPALRSFLENSEVPFRWTIEDELTTQPSSQTRLILYRIAQEALANARKHSEADFVRIRFGERDGGVSMEIADDGVGFRPQDAAVAAPGHMGLAAMRERAEMSGGSCALHSLPGQGVTLDVWMPSGDEEDRSEDERSIGPAEAVEREIRSA